MISAIIQNLQRGVNLLKSINDEQYSNHSTPPYYSSIGIHVRHILDVFQCVFDGLESGKIDLSARKRNELAEKKVSVGMAYFQQIIESLNGAKELDMDMVIDVKDDLGKGMVTAKYTLASALIQAHSHAIHHFASIGYIISQIGLELPDADFGYNPTTPRGDLMRS